VIIAEADGTKSTSSRWDATATKNFPTSLVVDVSNWSRRWRAIRPRPAEEGEGHGERHTRPRDWGRASGARRAILEFAHVLKGKRVKIDTFGVPATPEIVKDLQTTKWGEKTVWQILVDSGGQRRRTRLRGVPRRPGTRSGG